MSEPVPSTSSVPVAPPELHEKPGRGPARTFRLALRRGIPGWQVVVMGVIGAGFWLAVWWFVTLGEPEERIISPSKGLIEPC